MGWHGRFGCLPGLPLQGGLQPRLKPRRLHPPRAEGFEPVGVQEREHLHLLSWCYVSFMMSWCCLGVMCRCAVVVLFHNIIVFSQWISLNFMQLYEFINVQWFSFKFHWIPMKFIEFHVILLNFNEFQ